MDEVDLEVWLRRTERRIPVVLNVRELLALIGKLKEPCRLAAELQFGAELRLKELVTLRIMDVVLIYTHVATGVKGLGVRSPLDGIPVGSG